MGIPPNKEELELIGKLDAMINISLDKLSPVQIIGCFNLAVLKLFNFMTTTVQPQIQKVHTDLKNIKL